LTLFDFAIYQAMAWVGFSYNAPSVRTDPEAKKALAAEAVFLCQG